jgi:hypothetical protein
MFALRVMWCSYSKLALAFESIVLCISVRGYNHRLALTLFYTLE